jgi:hypothetical protein
MRIPHFWKALERTPITLREMWQAKLEMEFDEVERYLRPTGKLASEYPKRSETSGSWLTYEVVMHGSDHYVGVLPDFSRIPLRPEQLELYEPDWLMIRQNLAVALGVIPDLSAVGGCFRTHRLGHHRQLSGNELPVYLMIAYREERFAADVMALILEQNGPCLLVTPAETWMTPAVKERLHSKRIATLSLKDVMILTARGFQLVEPLGKLLIHSVVAPEPTPAIFHRQGQQWELAYAGKTVYLPHIRGLSVLAYLLIHPHRLLSARDVDLATQGVRAVAAGSAGDVLDQAAIESYRQKCDELKAELAEAERDHDLGQQGILSAELAEFEDQLKQALGLGGRKRKAADDIERCRKRMGNRIGRALKQIQDVHPVLGQHLQGSLDLGRVLCYRPESCPEWIT